MIFVLSPAKTLDYERPVPPELGALATRPLFVDQAAELIRVLRRQRADDVAALMALSPALAELNVARYAAWSTRFTDRNSRPAVLAFNGDVYGGLQAASLTLDDLQWAQRHLAILSGLYGVLRPLDRLQPYRLEMGTRLATESAADLYGFWGDTPTEQLNRWQARDKTPWLVNLASQEYFRVVRRKLLRARVIDCHFEDWHHGEWKVISFHAKRARGLMARFAIQQRLTDPQALQAFDAEGYRFDPSASTGAALMFRRRAPEGTGAGA